MSSWYVLCYWAIRYQSRRSLLFIQTPYVEESSLNLENGKVFSIKKIESGGENSIYINKVELNGKPYNKNYIHINDDSRMVNFRFIPLAIVPKNGS